MESVDAIIKALRCQCTAGAKCEHEACPYWKALSDEEADGFCESLGIDRSKVPVDFLHTCDMERCLSEAADMLEEQAWKAAKAKADILGIIEGMKGGAAGGNHD